MSNKMTRADFLKKIGLFSLVGAFGLSKFGSMAPVQAAVSDNTNTRNLTKDQIHTTAAKQETDVFTSGQSAAELAEAVNKLAAKIDSDFIKKSDLEFVVDGEDLTITKNY